MSESVVNFPTEPMRRTLQAKFDILLDQAIEQGLGWDEFVTLFREAAKDMGIKTVQNRNSAITL